jgi:hypothetical protein
MVNLRPSGYERLIVRVNDFALATTEIFEDYRHKRQRPSATAL